MMAIGCNIELIISNILVPIILPAQIFIPISYFRMYINLGEFYRQYDDMERIPSQTSILNSVIIVNKLSILGRK